MDQKHGSSLWEKKTNKNVRKQTIKNISNLDDLPGNRDHTHTYEEI
jgi:hypothetical protein